MAAARSGSSVSISSTPASARYRRPAALIRGARRKPRAPASTVSGSTEAAAISARRPTRGALAEEAQALADQAAVLADQRDHVGDGGEGDQIEVGVRGMSPAPHCLGGAASGRVAERRRQLVGDAGRAESLEGIFGDDRMDDRAVGERLARQVVVRDHDLHAGGPGGRDLLDGADAAVDGDDQVGAAAAELLDARHGQAVAVGEPVRDEPVALRPEGAEGRDEDGGRGDPVDVVVAMDGDPPRAPCDGEDALAGLLHAAKLAGLVGLARLEEAPSRVDRPVAAPYQRHRDRLGQLQLRREPPNLAVVIRICLERGGGCPRGHPAILSPAPDGLFGWPGPRWPAPAKPANAAGSRRRSGRAGCRPQRRR